MTAPEFQDHELTTTDGLTVYYRHRRGDGKHPAVILLHGLTGNRTAWEEFEVYFSGHGYPTFAMDLRGHGRSSKTLTSEQFSIPAFAADVRLLCEQHKLTNSIIVGHCYGGLVTLQAEHDSPKLFAKIVLVSPFYRNRKAHNSPVRTLLNIGAEVACRVPFIVPKVRRHFRYPQYWKLKNKTCPVFLYNDLLSNPLSLYQQGIKSASQVNALGLAGQIQKAVQVFSGTHDSFVPHTYSRLIADTIAHSRFEAYEGGDHIINIRYPERMCDSILHFIEETA